MWMDWIHYALASNGAADAFRPVLLDSTGRLDKSLFPATVDITGVTAGLKLGTDTAVLRPTSAFSLGDTATKDMDFEGAAGGLLFVLCTTEPSMAVYMLVGTGSTEILDPAGVYTNTVGSATRHNIYWNAGTSSWRLQNLRGAGRTYHTFLMGTA